MPAIAFAVSSSGEIMKSTSISPSRHASRSSMLVVRTTVFASERRLTRIAQTRLASSLELHAPDVVALGDAGEPSRVGVHDGQLVLRVERVDESATHVPGAEHDDLHAGRMTSREGSIGRPT